MSTEKHTVAMTFHRRNMKKVRELFAPHEKLFSAEDLTHALQEYETWVTQEIFQLLDKIDERKLI